MSAKPRASKPDIFIMVDMEGASGICQISQTTPEHPDYVSGRRMLTWDVNACVEGCFAGGAGRVVVRDAHHRGFNILWEEIDERAELVQGNSAQRMPDIADFDAMMLLGYHAMAGTPQGILEHTWSGSWQHLWINNVRCGEILLDAGIAGDHGVPVILVSGDDKTCAEAAAFLGDIVTVQVKKGFDRQGGQLLPRKTAHKLIRDGAAKAVRTQKRFKPLEVAKPVTMRLEVAARQNIPSRRAGVNTLDGRTFEVTADTVEEALNQL